jgi:hypothetical protein
MLRYMDDDNLKTMMLHRVKHYVKTWETEEILYGKLIKIRHYKLIIA